MLNRPDKALKRALSLNRILRLNSQSEKIIDLLKSPALAEIVRNRANEEVRATVTSLPGEIRELLGAPTATNGNDDEGRKRSILEECRRLIESTVQTYDTLMSRARSTKKLVS